MDWVFKQIFLLVNTNINVVLDIFFVLLSETNIEFY